jgi:biopolymer transport protein ExbB/TolQ
LLQLNLSVTWQDLQSVIRQFHHNLHETAQHVQDPKALKESVKKLYQKHCAEDIKQEGMEEDIQKEYNRQREYLEKSVESLKRKLHKDMESHRQDNMRIMQENVTLIKEINELRREVRDTTGGGGHHRGSPTEGGTAEFTLVHTIHTSSIGFWVPNGG